MTDFVLECGSVGMFKRKFSAETLYQHTVACNRHAPVEMSTMFNQIFEPLCSNESFVQNNATHSIIRIEPGEDRECLIGIIIAVQYLESAGDMVLTQVYQLYCGDIKQLKQITTTVQTTTTTTTTQPPTTTTTIQTNTTSLLTTSTTLSTSTLITSTFKKTETPTSTVPKISSSNFTDTYVKPTSRRPTASMITTPTAVKNKFKFDLSVPSVRYALIASLSFIEVGDADVILIIK
ncbi:hypothetical protein ACOME3_001650 [Neoechinorhynchus agilis]